jgi:putative transposase
MKAVCEALGVARSHLHVLWHRSSSWSDRRRDRKPSCDEELVVEIRRHIAELPSYGCRRACALIIVVVPTDDVKEARRKGARRTTKCGAQ